MYTKRILSIYLLSLIAALALAACGRAAATPAPTETQAPAPTETTAPTATEPEPTATATATEPPPAPAAAPANCVATVLTGTEVRVSWEIPEELADFVGFRLYQGVTSMEAEEPDPTITSMIMGNLEHGVQYHFDVRAYNDDAETPADACAVDVTP